MKAPAKLWRRKNAKGDPIGKLCFYFRKDDGKQKIVKTETLNQSEAESVRDDYLLQHGRKVQWQDVWLGKDAPRKTRGVALDALDPPEADARDVGAALDAADPPVQPDEVIPPPGVDSPDNIAGDAADFGGDSVGGQTDPDGEGNQADVPSMDLMAIVSPGFCVAAQGVVQSLAVRGASWLMRADRGLGGRFPSLVDPGELIKDTPWEIPDGPFKNLLSEAWKMQLDLMASAGRAPMSPAQAILVCGLACASTQVMAAVMVAQAATK